MLSYAYSSLNKKSYQFVSTEEFKNIADLFAAILAIGIPDLINRGLHREYVEKTEELNVPVGQINISASINKLTILNKKLVCSYDNLTDNIYINQILKSTCILLINSKDVKTINRKSLKKSLLYFSNVDCISIKNIEWSKVQYERNNSIYKMLINICYLVIEGLLQTTSPGEMKLHSFFDEQKMFRLYEKFVLNYYKKHYPQYSPKASYIEWNTDDDMIDLLPAMKSDIMLFSGDKTLIIDTKYYGHTLQNNSRFDNKTISSANLYQIFTYVKNYDKDNSGKVSGALLYAQTESDTQPDTIYSMSGNKIIVRTLNLNTEFSNIKFQLDDLTNAWLSA